MGTLLSAPNMIVPNPFYGTPKKRPLILVNSHIGRILSDSLPHSQKPPFGEKGLGFGLCCFGEFTGLQFRVVGFGVCDRELCRMRDLRN